ncbi:MAG: cell division protein FtsQ/DivIB [bacterium]|nr:cell division protein FtsQ/DivIB [bacterium]
MGERVQMRFFRRWSLLKKISVVIGIIAAMFLVFYFSFRLKNIEIDDCAYYTKDQLMKYIQADDWDNNTVLFCLDHKFNEQVEIPFIQKVTVEYVNKNSVKIRLYEKPIVGCIEYMNEYIYFDKDGKVLEISSNRLDDITLYGGVSFSEMHIYDTLAVKDKGVFKKIMDLSQLISKYQLTIDEVMFDRNQNVKLYADKIQVLLGNRTSYEDQIAELVNMLPKLIGLQGELDMQEFKAGQSSTIFKEIK